MGSLFGTLMRPSSETGVIGERDASCRTRMRWKAHSYFIATWIIGISGVAFFIHGPRPWEDAFVLTLLTITTGAGRRSAALVLGAVLFWASSPAVQLPTYWFCFVPLVWLWRGGAPGRWGWEAFAVGFLTAWLVAPFMRTSLPSHGIVGQVLGCSLIGVQFTALACGIRMTRGLPTIVSPILGAALATICELLQAVYGFGWSCMALSLPAAPTPLAQWAYYFGPFGVSFLLYLVNFLWRPDNRLSVLWRWVPPVVASVLAVLAYLGGYQIADRADVGPLPFTALIVQPQSDALHMSLGTDDSWPRVQILDRLTNAALAKPLSVDLIIWPESSMALSSW